MATTANIYLAEDLDTSITAFKIANSNTAVAGGATGDDKISILSGVTGTDVASTIESVTLSGALADYKFKQGFGSAIEVYATDGTTLIASISDVDTKKLFFSDGALDLAYNSDTNSCSVNSEILESDSVNGLSKYTGLAKNTEDGLIVYTKIKDDITTKYFVDDSSGSEVLVKYSEEQRTENENTSNSETFIEISISSNTFDANTTKIAEGNTSIIETTTGEIVDKTVFERVFVFDENGTQIGQNEHHEHIYTDEIRVSDVQYDIDQNSIRDTSVTTTTYEENGVEYTKVVTRDDTTFNESNRPTTIDIEEIISYIDGENTITDSTITYRDINVYSGDNARVTTRTYDDGTVKELEYDDNGVLLYEKLINKDSDGNVIGYTMTIGSTDSSDNQIVEITTYDTSDNILSTTKTTTYVENENYTNIVIDARVNNEDGTYKTIHTSNEITSTIYYNSDDTKLSETLEIGTSITKYLDANGAMTSVAVDVSQLGDGVNGTNEDSDFTVFTEIIGNNDYEYNYFYDADNTLVKYTSLAYGIGDYIDSEGVTHSSTNLRINNADGDDLKNIMTEQKVTSDDTLTYELIRTTIYNSDGSEFNTDEVFENGSTRFSGQNVDELLIVLDGKTTDADTVSAMNSTTLENFNLLDNLASGIIYADIKATNEIDIFNINGENILTIGVETAFTNATDKLDFTAYDSAAGTLAKIAVSHIDANDITLDTANTTVYVIDSDASDLDDDGTNDTIASFTNMDNVATFLNAGFTTNNEADETHFFVINDGSESTNSYIYKFTDIGNSSNTDIDGTELKLIGKVITDASATTVDDITIA